jgi:hypothetical protein
MTQIQNLKNENLQRLWQMAQTPVVKVFHIMVAQLQRVFWSRVVRLSNHLKFDACDLGF